jgi:predicted nuclease of predicted toxin-antitoxin system
MNFAVKLDENLSRAHVDLLRQAGYDVDRVDEQGLSGATDERVWERVCADGRLLVTLDLDFSDIRRYQPGTHPGILLIRARSRSASAVTDVLARVNGGTITGGSQGLPGGRQSVLYENSTPVFAVALTGSAIDHERDL